MTQGIENKDATKGLAVPGRNAGRWDAQNDAWRFSYDKGDPYIVEWHSMPISSPSSRIAIGDSIKMIPQNNPGRYAMVIKDQMSGCADTVEIDTIHTSHVDAGPNQIIPIGGSTTLNGTYSGLSNPACTTYAVVPIPYSPLSSASTTQVSGLNCTGGKLGDDEVSNAISIGFNFKFFCNTYSQLYVSSNGWVSFNQTTNSQPISASLPQTGVPNNLISMAWADLNPCGAGDYRYFVTGTAPNRKFVLNMVGVQHWALSSNPPTIDLQLILYEGSNIIEIHNNPG